MGEKASAKHLRFGGSYAAAGGGRGAFVGGMDRRGCNWVAHHELRLPVPANGICFAPEWLR